MFAQSKSDYLVKEEILSGLRELGLHPSLQAAEDLWDSLLKVDANNNGKIEFLEFEKFVLFRDEELWKIFAKIDEDRSGQLSVDEIARALHTYGVKATKQTIKRRIEEMNDITIDSNFKHKNKLTLTFEQFRHISLLFPSNKIDSMFQEDAENWHFGYYSIPKNDGTIKSNKSAMTIFLSGATAGLISRTMTAPADRVKVMLQASTSSNASIKSVVGDVWKEGGGIKGFWKGNGTNVIKIMPESAVKFYANDFFKSLIIKDQDNVQPHERLLAGSMAGVTAQSFIYPLEVVKTRLAIAAKGEYSSIAHCISKIIKKEGPKALYKGLGASNIGIIPYAGVDLAMYGTLKASWLKRNKDKKPQWYDLLLMGSLSSFTGQTCAYPLQLIRTRLQSSGMSGRPVYNGMSDVVRDVFRAEGFSGFYRGIGANFAKGIPATAIGYVAYEQSLKLYQSNLRTNH